MPSNDRQVSASLRELEAYLANVDYEKSTMGPFLDRLKLYGGAAEAPIRPKRQRLFKRREVSARALPKECDKCGAELKDETCDGCGWSHTLQRYRVTAEITAETHESQVAGPREDRLVRYARTSRRFEAFKRAHPKHAKALAAFHGVEAARYGTAASSPYYQLIAVMPLTKAGRKLVEKVISEKINAANTDPERLAMLVAQGKLKEQVSQVGRMAVKLYVEARALWMNGGDG